MNAIRQPAWICCHLGAREHYAVPRALHRTGRLRLMITDAWQGGWSRARIAARLSTRFGQRFHEELAGAPVRSLSRSLLAHQVLWRLQRKAGWDLMMARNAWFQERAAAELPAVSASRTFVFAHSYSAAAVFAEAGRRGWTTVLGQIDPGPEHALTLARLAAERPNFGPPPPAPPPAYFELWRRECQLADWIIVNSEWSRVSLMRAGIPERKLRILPLPFELGSETSFTRHYPDAFSDERPLRALFVGTASVGKGVADLLLALDALDGCPIELHIVGERALDVPERFMRHPRVRWIGRVDRRTVMSHYRSSDVLVFPSHSDGFGMAQIEARAWGLPLISSRHCGSVVEEGKTGYLLAEVTPEAIAGALRCAVSEPQVLAQYSRNAQAAAVQGIATLADGLAALERA